MWSSLDAIINDIIVGFEEEEQSSLVGKMIETTTKHWLLLKVAPEVRLHRFNFIQQALLRISKEVSFRMRAKTDIGILRLIKSCSNKVASAMALRVKEIMNTVMRCDNWKRWSDKGMKMPNRTVFILWQRQ
jgi:nicotinamide-nucleotide amidase